MKTKNFIQSFLTVLVIALLSGCGNQSDETAAKDIVVETEEEQVDSTNPDVYWGNIDVYFTNLEDAKASFANNSYSNLDSMRLGIEKYVDVLKVEQDRVVNLNVPDHPSYQEYHQQLIDVLPRLIKSLEFLLSNFPETNEEYQNNPKYYDDNFRYVELEAGFFDDSIQELEEKRTVLQEKVQ